MTARDYGELQALYAKYHASGFVVLGFPCNQFKAQEPGTDAEIKEFAASKGATFPLFSKIDVNGPTAHPLFQWLQTALPDEGAPTNDLKWNFTKFLLADGKPLARFGHRVNPLSFEDTIVGALGLPSAL